MATLLVLRGADEGKRFELHLPTVSLGRDATNVVRLHDSEVSRKHLEFRRTATGYRIVDLGSSNGTYVNQRKVVETDLRPGDHILVGQTELLYLAHEPAGTAPMGDLADRIRMIAQSEVEIPSAIIKTISQGEGSLLLSQPEKVTGQWLKTALANLSVMYQATQAVSHILDTDQLLERIMDLIFQSIEADRGCIMLRDLRTGELHPKVVRYRSGVDRAEQIAISRTVTEHVLREGQGVLVSDVAQDGRFAPAQSMVRTGVRQAICVPIKGRHETLGVLYLDVRAPAVPASDEPTACRRLTEDHLALAVAIGHQAALALEETRYHRAMVQAERLAAIGQTIAAISHHIKNILQGLRSGSDLLKMGIQEKNETLLLQGWKIVEKNQARIYDLVMDMLSYSKEREPAFAPTDLNAVVHDALELIEGRAREMGVRLELTLAPSLPVIQADAEGLHRALLNILTNGLDALEGRPNPTLTVSTSVEPDGQWLRISVADNGIGIPPERLPDLFKPFTSTKGARGTGLGLAVSHKILREHGGDILVTSQPNLGSQFILRLPVQCAPAPEPPEKQTSLSHT